MACCHERHERVLGLAQLLVGAGAQAIELSEVDLAGSPRLSSVRLLAGRLLICWWHLVFSSLDAIQRSEPEVSERAQLRV